MLKTTALHADPAPVFVVAVNCTCTPFSIDDDAFTGWLVAEGDELERSLPARSAEAPGQALSDLVYEALSAAVLVGDPGIELNVHGCLTKETGYVVRLNNCGGHQQPVGLTRGWHELRWPPNDLTPSEELRCYLQQICDVANTLLNDLPVTALSLDNIGGTSPHYRSGGNH
ncbi:hypothetical protein [Mycobacterium attenuatum]|uniref:hypothetical protein n=1 Tax=Mycobacterium attenuatum TaxID=2341086 RepID=UPI000F01FD4E|nr:hypothetical protein [Mycobacterium attenuatum]VBA62407.1 hypothetical protein LAUMK41_05798 [Mycobacterium attenuatum]